MDDMPPTSTGRTLTWAYLGRLAYPPAVALQERLGAALKEGSGGEHLLLLEHEPVFTLGRNASQEDIVADEVWRRRHGVSVHESNRGGKVTYHGPGQLVGYPIVDLKPDRRDVRRYVRDLQEVLIRTLADYGVAAVRREGQAHIGVWVEDGKIASIGVHLSRWITSHGFALNVATELEHFGGIVACGLPTVRMVSLASLLGSAPPLPDVAARVAHHFAAVFERRLELAPDGVLAVAERAADPVG